MDMWKRGKIFENIGNSMDLVDWNRKDNKIKETNNV